MSDTQNPYGLGFRVALEGMRLALRNKDVGRAYLKVAAVLFVLTLAIDIGAIWGLFVVTAPAADAAAWLVVALWAARVVGTLATLLIAPLLAIFTLNIVFPFFSQGVFLAALRALDPERAAALEARPGMPTGPAIGLTIRRLIKFVGLSLLLILVGLVPVAGSLVAAVAQAWLTARTVAWELLDPYFDALDIRYAEQKRLIAGVRKPLLGFGIPVALLLAIPIIGPLTFGLAQAAAANFVVRVLPIDPRETASRPAAHPGSAPGPR
jgi:CysZ protein